MRLPSCFIIFLIAIAYYFYRSVFFAGTMKYGMPLVSVTEFFAAIGKLPYIFLRSYLGYFAILLVVSALASQKWERRTGLFVGTLLVLQIAVLYPISFAILHAWPENGTWYRAGFMTCSLMIVLAAIGYSGHRHRIRTLIPWILMILAITQSQRSFENWHRLKAHYSAEGQFIKSGSAGLLNSTVPATWFPRCVAQMYQPQVSSFRIGLSESSIMELCQKQIVYQWRNNELQNVCPTIDGGANPRQDHPTPLQEPRREWELFGTNQMK
jgi:hypothetical protein